MLTQVYANIEIASLIWCSKEVDIYILRCILLPSNLITIQMIRRSFSEIHYKLFTILYFYKQNEFIKESTNGTLTITI
jgi:hypothetical protein